MGFWYHVKNLIATLTVTVAIVVWQAIPGTELSLLNSVPPTASPTTSAPSRTPSRAPSKSPSTSAPSLTPTVTAG